MKNLKVVNDLSERAVKLTEENLSKNPLTKNEIKQQGLLQVVDDYKRTFSKVTKEVLKKKLKT